MGEEVGKMVRRVRRNADLTQKQLAEKLKVESITVSRWERGVTHPSIPKLERIAEATNARLTVELTPINV